MSVMQRIRAQTPIAYLRNNTPLLQVNNTPIRTRMHSGKENTHLYHNKPVLHQITHASKEWENKNITDEMLNNSKTIPKKRISLGGRGCVNHQQLEAQFKIQIEGDQMGYCNRCAAHLASNGFKVQRIKQSRSPRVMREDPTAKKKKELVVFLTSLKKLENSYEDKGQYLKKIQASYEVEHQTIANFYAAMLQYLEYIRTEHLRFLQEQSQRSRQICEIESDQIAETLEELCGMREDVDNNMEKIVSEVDEESYQECLNYYQQKKAVHEHRLEELGIEAQPALCTTDQMIDQKLNEFKGFIDEMSGVLSSKADPSDY